MSKEKDKELRKKRKKAIIKFRYNLSTFVVITAMIMIWRSLWNFADAYLFPDDFMISNLVTLVWWFIIILLNKNFDLEDLV